MPPKRAYVSLEDFNQLTQKVESLVKAFKGIHEQGKTSRQQIEALEEKFKECSEKLCNLEETYEDLKENKKYSILTEGEYEYIEN